MLNGINTWLNTHMATMGVSGLMTLLRDAGFTVKLLLLFQYLSVTTSHIFCEEL